MNGAAALLLSSTLAWAQMPAPMDPYTRAEAETVHERRRNAAVVLEHALEAEAGARALATAAAAAADALSPESMLAARLRRLASGAEAEDLAAELTGLAVDLRFEPAIEAPLPAGWPPTAPVGEIVLKSYPGYRMARAPMAGRGSTTPTFFRLFRHIRSSDIPMTAPVQTGYERGADDASPRATSMAFLYRSEADGPLREDGAVSVVDVAPTLALGYGLRGFGARARLDDRIDELVAVLEAREDLEAAGPPRVMGYNSPMVPAARRFFEVEIPVRRAEPRRRTL